MPVADAVGTVGVDNETIVETIEQYGSVSEAAKHLHHPDDPSKTTMTVGAISSRFTKLPDTDPLRRRYEAAKGDPNRVLLDNETIVAAVEKYGSAHKAAKHLRHPDDPSRAAMTPAAISARFKKLPKTDPLRSRYDAAKGNRARSCATQRQAAKQQLGDYLEMVEAMGGVRNVERHLNMKKGKISSKFYRLAEDDPMRIKYHKIINRQRHERAVGMCKGSYSTEELERLYAQSGSIEAVVAQTDMSLPAVRRQLRAYLKLLKL